LLSFDDGSLTAPANTGAQAVAVQTNLGSGGTIEQARGPDGSRALRFPPFSVAEPPLAVLTVLATKDDFLSPGASDFEFGVDFSLDEPSEGGADNGNNLLQRGLFRDAAQYKLQIDHGLVSCRVVGSEGEAVATSATPVTAGTWYRARCTRRGDTLKLSLAALDSSGEVPDDEGAEGGAEGGGAETVARTGVVTLTAETPLSIGSKVTSAGEVVPSSPDQFNGALDNVVYTRLTD
jgi:hypothetical protein